MKIIARKSKLNFIDANIVKKKKLLTQKETLIKN
jgi:hypothetical protein